MSKVKHKNMIKPKTTRATIKFTNGKEYTIPRALDLTIEGGKMLSGVYDYTETKGDIEFTHRDVHFNIPLTNVSLITIRGRDGYNDLVVEVVDGVVASKKEILKGEHYSNPVAFSDYYRTGIGMYTVDKKVLWDDLTCIGGKLVLNN